MNVMSTISLFFLVITISLLGHCCTVVRSDDLLIAQTCQKTPNSNLCVSSLKSDPKSSSADIRGLALIMIKVVNVKASRALQQIKTLLRSKPELIKPLSSCADHYNAILTADIPSSVQAVQLGDPKFGETGMNDAANEAINCENGFRGKSPLSVTNHLVHDTSSIAAAIIRLLL